MRRRVIWWWSSGALAVVLVGIFLFTTWPRDILGAPLTLHDAPAQADVIIVLGAGTRDQDENNLPPQAEQRVAEGALLYKEKYASSVIVAGGKSPVTHLVEADLMASLAELDGVPAADLVLERTSRDTWQNAENSLAIMKTKGWKTALVVTSPYHTRRACHFFRKQGATVHCMAAPYSLVPANSLYERFMDNRSVVREYGAWIYAWLQGRL